MKAMFNSSSVFPPYTGKGNGEPEKDYIHDNMKRVRQTSSQVKQTKTVPMKVKFIPGVTKNPKFEHVGSRIAGLIRAVPKRGIDDETSTDGAQVNGRGKKKSNQEIKPIWGASAAANARRSLSNSATDLRSTEGSGNKFRNEVPPYLRRKPKPIQPHEESVYNWRFVDTNSLPSNFAERQRYENPEKFAKFPNARDVHVHRVEYLPCDGICAEETLNTHNGDSGRSSSSSRTSRGINTEETRIYPEESLRQSQSLDQLENWSNTLESPIVTPPSMFTKTRNLQTQTTANQFSNDNQFRSRQMQIGQGDADVTDGFSNLRLNGGGSGSNLPSAMPNTVSNSTLNHFVPGPGGDQPTHTLGVVPKYLKSRQQQWKLEEEAKRKKETEEADVPPGHMRMPEAERVQTLKELKTTYDNLVNDLNRIPIHIDTIRVRDHKIELEKQLTKLEQAMRIFSRPKVYVKKESGSEQ